MSQISDFIKYLRAEVRNHSVYVWGGQGEPVKDRKVSQIAKMETSGDNTRRVLALIGKFYAAGYDMSKAKCFDCSGLMTYYLVEKKLIDGDTTAHGLKGMCVEVSEKNLQPGDLIFKLDKATKRATHVAAVVQKDKDGTLWIVEAQGRDVGVIERKYNKSFGFSYFGRPKFWT